MRPEIKTLLFKSILIAVLVFITNCLLHYWWDDAIQFERMAITATFIGVAIFIVGYFFPDKKP